MSGAKKSFHEVRKVAAQHLLAAINGEPAHAGVHTVPGWLVVRASTGAAPF